MYGKIFSSMYEGTLYGHWQALVTFQQMIVLCEPDGTLDMTPHALAARTSIPLEIIQEGIRHLEEPDHYSRSAEAEGRRITRLDSSRPWGWRIVNHGYYKTLASAEEKREKDRVRIADKRRQNATTSDMSLNNADKSPINDECRDVSLSVVNVAYADADADKDKDMSTSSTVGVQEPATEKSKPIEHVFDHWRSTHKHPKAVLGKKRRRSIAEALKSYTPESLCDCITGYLHSPYHRGKNDGKVIYDDIEMMLRDEKHIEAGLKCMPTSGTAFDFDRASW